MLQQKPKAGWRFEAKPSRFSGRATVPHAVAALIYRISGSPNLPYRSGTGIANPAGQINDVHQQCGEAAALQ
jgi:hypothetical protein